MKCKSCKYFNDFAHTYIINDGKMECCSYWHIAYHKWESKGDKPCCKEYQPIKRQLTLFEQ